MPRVQLSPTPASPPTPADGPVLPVVPAHWTFPADPVSVRRARRVVAEVLPDGHRPQLGDDLGLLASELVTNAVRHGPQPAEDHVVELVVWPADGHYWLAVSDARDGDLPALTSPHIAATGGRGLLLVDALASAWGVVPRRSSGKCVVAGIRVTQS